MPTDCLDCALDQCDTCAEVNDEYYNGGCCCGRRQGQPDDEDDAWDDYYADDCEPEHLGPFHDEDSLIICGHCGRRT